LARIVGTTLGEEGSGTLPHSREAGLARGHLGHVLLARVGLNRSMQRGLFPALLAFSLVTSGCAAKVQDAPFVVPREEFYRRIRTIAVLPVTLPRYLGGAGGARARVDALIETSLRKAGFAIVPSQEVAGVWRRVLDEIDRAMVESVAERLRDELRRGFSVDGVLHPSVRVVRAEYGGGWVAWDGAREPTSIDGSWGVGSHLSRGTVGALSLFVTVEDTSGATVYLARGGIQVLSKISGLKFVPVPVNDLLASEERNRAAVDLAVGPLVRRP